MQAASRTEMAHTPAGLQSSERSQPGYRNHSKCLVSVDEEERGEMSAGMSGCIVGKCHWLHMIIPFPSIRVTPYPIERPLFPCQVIQRRSLPCKLNMPLLMLSCCPLSNCQQQPPCQIPCVSNIFWQYMFLILGKILHKPA